MSNNNLFSTGDLVKLRRDIPNAPYYIEAWLDDELEVTDRYEGTGGPETSYKVGNEYGNLGPLPESWLYFV